MAKGDFVMFEGFIQSLFSESVFTDTNKASLVNPAQNDLKLGLITDAVTPTVATAGAHWGGASGTTNFFTNEIANTGQYGGPVSILKSGGSTIVANGTDWDIAISDGFVMTWAEDVSNPTNARWGIVYITGNDNVALGFIDLGVLFDMSGGDLDITVPSGVTFTIGPV